MVIVNDHRELLTFQDLDGRGRGTRIIPDVVMYLVRYSPVKAVSGLTIIRSTIDIEFQKRSMRQF